MTDKEMKAAAIRQLRRQGHVIASEATMVVIASKILGKQPNNAPSMVIRNWLAVNPEPQDYAQPAESRVAPIEPHTRPQMKHVPHPRLAEINAGQPPLYTPTGNGNGVEGRHGYGRGK